MKNSTLLNRPIQKVFLVFPPGTSLISWEPQVTTPLGLAYLAASLRDQGFDVACLDSLVEDPFRIEMVSEHIGRNGLSFADITQRVADEKPDVVGLSCIFSNQWPAVKELAKRIKGLDKDILIASGGTHPSFQPEKCLRDSELDLIMLGEADHSFGEALDLIRRGKSLAGLDGVAYKDGSEVRVNPKTSWIENLDDLPFPAHDLFPLEKYFKAALPMGYSLRSKRSLPIVTSRGCPCRCNFCSSTHHWGKKYRTRSPENVIAEIEWLTSRFGVEELKFQDDNLTSRKARAKKIFEMMCQFNPRIHWNTPNGIAIWTLDDDMLKLMKKSGCYEITLAVESGDQEVISKLINKPLKLEQVESVSRMARKHGIARTAYFIIGFPGETRAQIDNTVRFSRKLNLDTCIIFIYNPLPGSKMYDDCLRLGYITEDSFFEAGNLYFSSILDSEDWSAEELEKTIRREFFRSYLNIFRNPKIAWSKYYNLFRHRPASLRYAVSRSIRAVSLIVRSRLSKLRR